MYKIISDKVIQRLSDGAFICKGTRKIRNVEVFSNAWLAYQQWLETEEGQLALEQYNATAEGNSA